MAVKRFAGGQDLCALSEIGVTDDEGSEGAAETRRSSSGARLYCQGLPQFKGPILLMVAQLLLESDFDVGVEGRLCAESGSGRRRDRPKT